MTDRIPVSVKQVTQVALTKGAAPIVVGAAKAVVSTPTAIPAYPVRIVETITQNGSAEGFNFTQSIPADMWNIPHNLGYKPDVSVRIGAADVDCQVLHYSNDVVQLYFVDAVTGTARCI